MLPLFTLKLGFESSDFLAVHYSICFKTLNFVLKLVDDAPGDDLLTSNPNSCLLIVGLSEEDLEVEQVAELASLEDLDKDAGHQWHMLNRSLFLLMLEGTDPGSVELMDAVVEQRLQVACEV